MKWFGEPYPSRDRHAHLFDDPSDELPAPFGKSCLYCCEPIAMGDRGVILPYLDREPENWTLQPTHFECLFRQILGSVAHQNQDCACFKPISRSECDDTTLSIRNNARAALRAFEERNKAW